MMEVAAQWLAVNPDPLSPFLAVPGLEKNTSHASDLQQTLAHYEALAQKNPAIAPQVEELRKVIKERDEKAAALHETEAELEQYLTKAPTMGHAKHSIVDDVHHSLVGRWSLAWARQGYNVFDLSPHFTAAMLLTDARELDISDIRLPFGGMLFMISDGFAKGVEGTSYTKIHVTEVSKADRSMLEACDHIVDAVKDLSPSQVSEVLRGSVAQETRSILETKRDDDDTAIHIYASDGASVLETWIDRKGLTWDAFDNLPDEVTEDADKQARHALRQIVFGAIAYTNAVEGSMEERFGATPPKKAPDKLRARQWTIGRTIQIDPKLVSAVRSGTREVAFRLKHRHIVRGHYRNQAHGPAHSLRTKTWIQPHWRGPEQGAALVHTYKIDGSGSDSSSS
jgi:hypothetical protein